MTALSLSRLPLLAVATVWLLALGGCATRTVRETVFHENRVEVELRHTEKNGEPVNLGYSHPYDISPTQLADLLSRLQIRDRRDGVSSRGPAIDPGTLFIIAKGLSIALERANSSQEIAVVAVHKVKSLGIFDTKYLTSFIAYAKDGELAIHLSRVNWEIPKTTGGREQRLPQPHLNEHPMDFRVVAGDGLRRMGDQSIGIALGDTAPDELRVGTRDGRAGITVRRAVLVLSSGGGPATVVPLPAPAPAASEGPAALPPRLTPETLRALADLEEDFQAGRISEPDYEARRAELLGATGSP